MISAILRDQGLHIDIGNPSEERVKRIQPPSVAFLGDVGVGVHTLELDGDVAAEGWKLTRQAQ